MIAWKRSVRVPASLRRWINTVRAVLYAWSQPYRKRWTTRFFLPHLRRPRRILPCLEVLEARITPTTVQFLQATSTVMEFPTANFFRVGLSAPSSQTVTVQSTTSDGTAKAGTDYTATSGTLTFMPGTTQQNIRVNILDDNLVNEPSAETFTLTLSNPTNATLGSQTTDTVSIDEDNDGGSSSTLPPSLVGAPTCNDG